MGFRSESTYCRTLNRATPLIHEVDKSDEEWWREVDAPRAVPEPQGLVNQVAARFRSLSASDSPAASDLCSNSSLQRYMASVAYGSKDCQVAVVHQIFQYIQTMQAAGSFEPILFVQQIHFDESPLKLKVSFSDDAGADLQIGKVVAVQVKWIFLVGDLRALDDHEHVDAAPCLRDHLLLTGTMSSQVRACDKGTGEALACVLRSCMLQHGAQAGFKTSLLLYEADSLGANDRCINLLRGEYPSSVILRLRCLCHRVHTSAQRTFSMWPLMLQGVSRTLLVLLQQPGVFAAFRKALVNLVQARCRRVDMNMDIDLPEIAQSHRENCMRYFSPSSRRGRAVVRSLSMDLFNGDWREKEVMHRCRGCCSSLVATQNKMKAWICKLLKTLGRRLLNRGNWLHWQESLPLIALLMSLHNLFFDAFFSAISKATLAAPDDGNAADDPPPVLGDDDADRIARWRVEQAEHRQKATEWLQSGRAWHDLYLCRVALDPEVELMRSFVTMVSREWEAHNLSMMKDEGRRHYRVKLLHEHVHRFMVSATAQMLQADLWTSVTVTQLDVSWCWKTLLRPMSAVFQLVQHELNTFPLKIFELVGGSEDDAGSFLATPACVLDDFGLHFRRLYDTVDKILAQEAQQTLTAIATLAETNTFKTESFHSMNSRKLSSRRHTHAMTLPVLAVDHLAVAAPSWLTEAEKAQAMEDNRVRAPKRVSHLPRLKQKHTPAHLVSSGSFQIF